MSKTLSYIVAIPGFIFLASGIGWLIMPEFVGSQLGMELLDGKGLSTQIGDLASFFIVMGSCIFLGLKNRNKFWFYPVIMLLIIAASGRVIAWLIHGAYFAVDMIAVEIAFAFLLYHASKRIANEN